MAGERAKVLLETSSGKVRVLIDGELFEEEQIQRRFAGMYGMFVVNARTGVDALFPFAIDPGKIPGDREPNIGRLKSHFEKVLPATYLDFHDEDWVRDSCTSPPASEIGLGQFAYWLRVQSSTFCLVHWNGAGGGTMLVSSTLAEGDPWMRPFSRRLCRAITEAALARLARSRLERPTYAACVLVDRPDRTGPTGAQTAFTSEMYEVRSRDLARILDVRSVASARSLQQADTSRAP
jgi:hypothetical protein